MHSPIHSRGLVTLRVLGVYPWDKVRKRCNSLYGLIRRLCWMDVVHVGGTIVCTSFWIHVREAH